MDASLVIVPFGGQCFSSNSLYYRVTMATCPLKRLAASPCFSRGASRHSSKCLGPPGLAEKEGQCQCKCFYLKDLKCGREKGRKRSGTQRTHKKCWWKWNEAAPLWGGALEQGNFPESKDLRCPMLPGNDGGSSTGDCSGLG